MIGFQRKDGRKGIRNVVLVVYLVECAHHVAREIAGAFSSEPVHLVGFPGCYPNAYAHRVLESVATHPNVGAVLLISLGCESFDRESLAAAVEASGRPVATIVIQETGGTARSIELGRTIVSDFLRKLDDVPRTPIEPADLIVGTICGGSDATSGLTANPACGRAFDLLIEAGGTAIFEETSELIGCEHLMAERAASPELGREIVAAVEKAARYHQVLGHGSFAPGNAEGGLSTIEEKSLGAYAKSGQSTISGILKPAVRPPRPGLYLLDVVPDGDVRFGFPNIVDNAEIVELVSCGCHLVLFTTGRGSVVGSVISPVVKVCANPDTYRRMKDDMDINAGKILDGSSDLDQVGKEIYDRILRTAAGEPTASERLGHREFILGYKRFEPLGPACLP
ncbi:MAG: hydrolase [Planctomycetota bacterium]|nr:MAG: hydrolase [Planctomycetota bacterium]